MNELDLTGVVCPLNWVKAKLELETMRVGETLRVYLDPGEAIERVPESARQEGHSVEVREATVTIVKR